MLGVADVKDILCPLAHGHDLGPEQIDALVHHDLADVAEQSRPIARGDLEHRALVALIGRDVDLRCRVEHAHLPRRAAGDADETIATARERAGEGVLDLLVALGIGDRRAVFFEHVINVDAVAIARRRDARIDDVEPELIEHGGGTRKAVLAVRSAGHDRGRAALALGLHRHHGHIILLAGELAREPGDLLRRVPEKTAIGELLPDGVDVAGVEALRHEQLARLGLILGLQLVLIDGRLEAAAQGSLDAIVDLTEKRRLPGVPQSWIGRAHIGRS